MPAGPFVRTSVVLLAAFAGVPPARAADPPPSWRLFAGVSLFAPSFGTPYTSTYSPAFQYVEHTGTATQVLPLDAGRGPGLWLGVQRGLGPHVGLELAGRYGKADISGLPGHYDLTMRYTSRPPPQYQPVEVSVHRSDPQPAAEGTLKTLELALDLVAWAGLGKRGRLGVAAGPAWLHVRGEAQSLVHTAFFIGGHSTAFFQDTLLSFELASSAVGVDAGAFAEVDLGSHVGLRLDTRYCWAPEQDADVSLIDVVNAGEVSRSTPLDEIERTLAPAPVRLDPSSFRAAVALALRF